MPRPHGLSKSRYTAGLQCHKQLWWRVHEPDAPELVPDAGTQKLFDTGLHVGAVARGYVPGGVLIDLPHTDYEGKVAETQRAIEAGAPAVYEASFAAGQVFVAVDILVREPPGWRVIEVKSTTSLKEQHLPDAAIQTYVARQTGLRVTGADVMVLNRACAFPDLSNLFTRHDVSADVEALQGSIPDEVRSQLSMLAGPLPAVPIGPHCSEPYDCPFIARCWPVLPRHHVSTLFRSKNRAQEFEALGYVTIHDLPGGLGLNVQAERQRRAVRAGRMIVEGDLGHALEPFQSPLAFLDFETVQFAIPIWDGCHPYDQIPAQFSCHRERPGGDSITSSGRPKRPATLAPRSPPASSRHAQARAQWSRTTPASRRAASKTWRSRCPARPPRSATSSRGSSIRCRWCAITSTTRTSTAASA